MEDGFPRKRRKIEETKLESISDDEVMGCPEDEKMVRRIERILEQHESVRLQQIEKPEKKRIVRYMSENFSSFFTCEDDDFVFSPETTRNLSPTDPILAPYLAEDFLPPPPKKQVFVNSSKGTNAEEMRDWSKRFDSVVDQFRAMKPNTDLDVRVGTNEELGRLDHDFLLSAELFGRVIISEAKLPVAQKTVKPVDIGGVAGGVKYIVRNIIFKFCVDKRGLYGGDGYAAKAAGHELKGAMSYYNCFIPKLYVPLMAIIDYRGFRLLAMSMLPISKGRLIYGSKDAGQQVFNEVPEFDEKMKLAANKLNLAQHVVSGKKIWSAFDVEGHLVEDRLYLLDLARVFPKAEPIEGSFHRLLRPELIKRSKFPVSSDAGKLRIITQTDENWEDHLKRVEQLTKYLKEKIIPDFADIFVSKVKQHYSFFAKHFGALQLIISENKIGRETQPIFPVFGEDFPLKQELHAEGINLRFLGVLMREISEQVDETTQFQEKQHSEALLFIEMCARTLRQLINESFRKRSLFEKDSLNGKFIEFLNQIFGTNYDSDRFWENDMRNLLSNKFGLDNLPPWDLRRKMAIKYPNERRIGSFSNDKRNGKVLLYLRLKKLMCFSLNEITEMAIISEPSFFDGKPFDIIDLSSLDTRVKHMGVVNHALGYSYKMRSRNLNPLQSYKIRPERISLSLFLGTILLLQKARQNFEKVLETNPNATVTLRNCGQVIQQIETIYALKNDPSCKFLDLQVEGVSIANDYFLRAYRTSPKDTHSLYQYAQFLVECGKIDEAEKYFVESLEADPFHLAALIDFGFLLHVRQKYGPIGKRILQCVAESDEENVYRVVVPSLFRSAYGEENSSMVAQQDMMEISET